MPFTICPVLISSNNGTVLSPSTLISISENVSNFSVELKNVITNEMHLLNFKPNLELFSSSYKIWPNCHFMSINENSEVNMISLCSSDSITGMLQFGTSYFILDVISDGSFALIPQNSEGCSWSNHRHKRSIGDGIPSYYAEYLDGKKRYVEFALVADYSMYKKYGMDENKVLDRLHAIANVVNGIYMPLNIRVTLVYATIWKDGDLIEVTPESDLTLTKFLDFRRNLMKVHPHDNAQLVTEVKFDNLVIGKAYKGTMCSYEYSGGVISDHSPNAASVASTSAHEMGHSFGMIHDPQGCECPTPICLMEASNGGYSNLSYFSSCSLRYLQQSFVHQMDYCLFNVPKKVFGGAKCGNGIVEDGEDCDCGNLVICPNKCCVASKCQLAKDAVCASGDCCDIQTCKPKFKATICRPILGECDLPEFCDGDTGDCPADFFVQNGLLCPKKKQDYCYEGECGSRNDQCKMIWGQDANAGDQSCFRSNLQGNRWGNCGWNNHSEVYLPCKSNDYTCGKLFCNSPNTKPIFGDISSVIPFHITSVSLNGTKVDCRAIHTSYSDGKYIKDPAMVKDGAKCGKEGICVGANCQQLSEITRFAPKCDPENCFNKGICNNVGNCHCEYGYGGPGCDIPGYGGSVNSGPATDQAFNALPYALVFLAVLFTLFACVDVFYHRKRNNWLHSMIWKFLREWLNIHAIRVPTRKAPPPPGGRARRNDDLNAIWGNDPNTLHVGNRPIVPSSSYCPQPTVPTFVLEDPTSSPSPPAIPIKLNRSDHRQNAHVGFKPEVKALNLLNRTEDSSSDENSANAPPPVPAHRQKPTGKPPPPIKEKPKLPQKPPVASKPANSVKSLAAKFDAKNSNVDLV